MSRRRELDEEIGKTSKPEAMGNKVSAGFHEMRDTPVGNEQNEPEGAGQKKNGSC